MNKRTNRNNPASRKRLMTPEEKEDAWAVALIRKEQAKGGKTYSHAQVMRELGYHDLALPLHKRG
jgi:hypothetical protein